MCIRLSCITSCKTIILAGISGRNSNLTHRHIYLLKDFPVPSSIYHTSIYCLSVEVLMGFKFPRFHHWCCHSEGLLGFAPEPNSVIVRIKAACSSKTMEQNHYTTIYQLWHIHQIHTRFNKPTGYQICHQIIQKYTIYVPHQSICHSDKIYKYKMRNAYNKLKINAILSQYVEQWIVTKLSTTTYLPN